MSPPRTRNETREAVIRTLQLGAAMTPDIWLRLGSPEKLRKNTLVALLRQMEHDGDVMCLGWRDLDGGGSALAWALPDGVPRHPWKPGDPKPNFA